MSTKAFEDVLAKYMNNLIEKGIGSKPLVVLTKNLEEASSQL